MSNKVNRGDLLKNINLKIIVKNPPDEEKQKELLKEITEFIQINYYSQKRVIKMSKALTEDEIIMNAIHENYKKNNKKYLKKLQNSKLTLLDVILVNV